MLDLYHACSENAIILNVATAHSNFIIRVHLQCHTYVLPEKCPTLRKVALWVTCVT